MNIDSLLTTVFVWWVTCEQGLAFAVSRAQDITSKDVVVGEPSCEQLKAMWRYSKRQSRAAEVTNEIPTYVDPFAYNIWNPTYTARSRSIGGFPVGNKYRARPIYGRVVQNPAILRVQDVGERNRAFEEVVRLYGQPYGVAPEPRRRLTTFRVAGGHTLVAPQSGSFQHLKNIIKSERARELHNQHVAEEAVARSTSANKGPGKADVLNQPGVGEMNYNYEMEDRDEQPEAGRGIMVFPDILAPGSHTYQDDIEAYYRENPYQRTHSSALLDPSNINGEMDSMMY